MGGIRAPREYAVYAPTLRTGRRRGCRFTSAFAAAPGYKSIGGITAKSTGKPTWQKLIKNTRVWHNTLLVYLTSQTQLLSPSSQLRLSRVCVCMEFSLTLFLSLFLSLSLTVLIVVVALLSQILFLKVLPISITSISLLRIVRCCESVWT